jgi:hypothetical protein
MTGAPLPDLILYARPGCHLCEETRTLLERLLAERANVGAPVPALVERDIESDPALHRAMVNTIPVVEVGGRRLELAVGPGAIRRFIATAYDSDGSA